VRPARPLNPAQLFAAFFQSGITGFGGVLPMIRRIMVEERKWQSASEFNELFALCQFLPGANVVNLSVIFGACQCGLLGSVAALAGLLGVPIVIVLCMALLYDRFGNLPMVRHLMIGLAAGAAGLVLSTAVKIAIPLRGSVTAMLVCAACFVALGILRLPFLPSLAVLVPLSILLASLAPRG
jgi:chromate transporter